MTLSEELAWRGFVNQTTYQDISTLNGDPITFYWGVDPSSDSMTVGNLAIAMMVRHFIHHGHRAVLLVGGATGLIGDPDGKKQERDLVPLEAIQHNKRAIVHQYKQLFAAQPFTVVDNYEWFKDMGYLSFLREVGKHVPMRQMLSREFVQSRLGEEGTGISYAEFSYSLIQGYDFLHLYRTQGVTLQVCGADQWGNSIAGVELIRRIDDGEANVWSAPLIVNKATGVKFGKSEEGAVWLDAAKTSVFKFYQFWLNVDDESAADFLKVYTLLDKSEIDRIIAAFDQNKASRIAQKTLAFEVTKIVHGEDKAKSARQATEVLFGGADFRQLTEADIHMLQTELPTVQAHENDLPAILQLSGLASSRSEAVRMLGQGAVSLNGTRATGNEQLAQGYNLLKRGKNSFVLIKR